MASIACPLDQAEWKDRSRHCVSNEQSYHCLGDEYGNLVDACVDPVWIQPGKLNRTEHTFNAGITDTPGVTSFDQGQTSKVRKYDFMIGKLFRQPKIVIF